MIASSKIFEAVVGAIVLLFAAIFAIYLFGSGDDVVLKGRHYSITAAFDRADGIGVGSDVKISGIAVGKVTEQKLDQSNYSAVLTLALQDDVKVPMDTSAEIISSGLVGDKYIALIPGGDSEYIKDRGVIEFTQSSISLEGIISKIAFSSENKKITSSEDPSDESIIHD